MSVSKFRWHVLKKHKQVDDVIVKEGEAERQDKGETDGGDLHKTNHKTML